jgi:uncharacterized protein
MPTSRNIFATLAGILTVGAVIGILAALLQKLGNPANMGICVACFERDIAGSIGLHQGSCGPVPAAGNPGLCPGLLSCGRPLPRVQAAGAARPPSPGFSWAMIAMIGSLVFLGCPWRAVLRLAGGDGNALFGIAGLAAGVFAGTLFFRKGYSLGRSTRIKPCPQG